MINIKLFYPIQVIFIFYKLKFSILKKLKMKSQAERSL